jgi:hypothetical protein
MAKISKRVSDLEQHSAEGAQVRVFVNWSPDDDFVLINGQRMSKAEFEALYPDAVVVNWDDEPSLDEPDISQLA